MPFPSESLLPSDSLLPVAAPTAGVAARRLYDKLSIYQPEDESLGYPLLAYVAALGLFFEPFEEAAREQEDGSDGTARLLDPERAPAWALDWLSMFPGVVYPKDISEARKRQLLLQTPAQDRATQQAIEGAARAHLTDPEASYVFISAPSDPADPWSLLVVTLQNETPDEAQTLRDLTKGDVIAAGVNLTYVVRDSWLVKEAEAEYASKTVAEFEAAFASVHAAETKGVI